MTYKPTSVPIPILIQPSGERRVVFAEFVGRLLDQIEKRHDDDGYCEWDQYDTDSARKSILDHMLKLRDRNQCLESAYTYLVKAIRSGDVFGNGDRVIENANALRFPTTPLEGEE